MNPRGTFERVYDAIRARIEAAAYAPGDHLEPSHLADALNSSVTPVRDALQRLVGERMVEASPGDGFRLPILTEVGLRQLYDWHCQLLLLALKRMSGPKVEPEFTAIVGDDTTSAAFVARTSALFTMLGRRSGNAEQAHAISALEGRLSMVRHNEARLIPNHISELEALEMLAGSDEIPALRRALVGYHRRRQRLADRLVVALQVPTDIPVE